eukprot:Lithocolla_globosa_v1_NODE_2723_length_1891_cov_85.545752.p1 type:complete len:431 gc:universal NODE_2723_length_1891_cov_85.545752:180-1472(+)
MHKNRGSEVKHPFERLVAEEFVRQPKNRLSLKEGKKYPSHVRTTMATCSAKHSARGMAEMTRQLLAMMDYDLVDDIGHKWVGHCQKEHAIAMDHLVAYILSLDCVEAIGVACDGTSKVDIDRDAFEIQIYFLIEGHVYVYTWALRELCGKHEKGNTVADMITEVVKEIQEIQSQNGWHVRSFYELTAYACADTTNVNTGEDGGWIAVLEKRRRTFYTGDSSQYRDIQLARCTDHVVSLMSKWFQIKLAEMWPCLKGPNGYFLSAIHYVCQTIQELLRGRLGSLFDGFGILLGLPHFARYRVSSGRYITIDNMASDILMDFPALLLFFWRMRCYSKRTQTVFNLLSSAPLVVVLAVCSVAVGSIYKPVMEVAAKATSATLMSAVINGLQNALSNSCDINSFKKISMRTTARIQALVGDQLRTIVATRAKTV